MVKRQGGGLAPLYYKVKVFNKKQTKEQLRKSICSFAKKMGVQKVIFNNNAKYVCGTYNAKTKHVYLSLKQSKQKMLVTFFHELGHHAAVLKNKWNVYHYNLVPSMRIDAMFNIENKVDKIGNKLWYKYVDLNQWGRYKYFYPKSQKKLIMNIVHNQ